MATQTFHDYTGDGSDLTFDYSFPTFAVTDVVVELDGVIVDNYTIPSYATSGTKTVTFDNTTGTLNSTYCESSGAPKTGVAVRVYRDTGVDTAKATYAAGSSVKAGDLNDNQTQVLRALQEEQNQTITTTKLKDGAITSAKILDGTIVDADVNASAAIAQTKIALDADLTTLSSMQTGAAAKVALLTATEVETLDGITASTAELNILDGVTSTAAELNILDGVTSTTAELNILDGVTSTAAELNILDGVTSTTAELNILDGVTATTAELNIMDGVTATTAELNYTDGVTSNIQTQLDAKQPLDADLTSLSSMQTGAAAKVALLTADEVEKIDGLTSSTTELNKLDGVTASATDLNIVASMTKQTTISDSDTSYPTSGAVVDYVASALQPFGGFEAVADEDSFPTTQPASRVVISINDASGVVVNGSGVSTTARTTGNGSDNVTINGFPSSLYSTTLSAGNGLQVSSTGSSQTYTYHKLLASETDVKQLSDDINDFNSRYRIASSAPGSNNDEGDLYFDTASNKMYVYDGSAWGEVTSTGDFKYLVLTEAGTTNAASYDGSKVSFDLKENTTGGSAASVTNAAQLMVSINGVVQKPNDGTNTSGLDGFVMTDADTIKFTAGVPTGASVFVVQSGSALAINVTGDNTVTEAKLNVSNSPTNDYVLTADATVTGGLKWAETAESSPTTTRGDIIYRGASADQRLAKGTSGQYLQIGANDPVWADVVAATADGCLWENNLTISNDYTIASTKGAHSVGPITVNATVTVNGNWVVS